MFMSRTNLLANLIAIVHSEISFTNETFVAKVIHCMHRLMWPHRSSLWRNGGKFRPAACANSGSARCSEVVSSTVDISSRCAGISLTSGRRRASPM